MNKMREAIQFDDYLIWLNHQIELLRARKFEQLDLDDLIDELDDMGRSRKKELKIRLTVLVKHLLKCKVQPDHICGSWLGTLNEQRTAIRSLLEDAHSIGKLASEYLQLTYSDAVSEAVEDTTLPISCFPAELPLSPQQVLDRRFIPGSPAVLWGSDRFETRERFNFRPQTQ